MADIDQFEDAELGSPIESRDGFNLRATRIFTVPWADRYTYRAQLIALPGYGELYPYAEGFDARCRAVRFENLGRPTRDSAGLIVWEKCRITAEYSTPTAGAVELRPGSTTELIAETFEPTMEFLTLDARGFFWDVFAVDEPLQADEAPGVLIQGAKYSFTRHGLDFVRPEILSWAGSINNAPLTTYLFGSPALTFGAYQVLYGAPSIAIQTSAGGARKYSVTLPFIWKQIPSWNKFFRARYYTAADPSAAWRPIYNSAAELVKPYPERNLQSLRVG